MKKILVTLLVVSAMVVSLAAAAMANSVYVDGVVSGNERFDYDDGSPSEKSDLSGFAVGTNLNFGRILFNAEYEKSTAKETGSPDLDYKTLNLKGGVALLSYETGYLALTAGYHERKQVDAGKYNGVLIGLSFLTDFGEKSRLEATTNYSVSGTFKFDGDPDVDIDIWIGQIKYSYYLTDNFGLEVGYKATMYLFDKNVNNVDKDLFYGPTVGLTYKF